jgi:membrane-associated phospholipid phosphatase
MILTAATIPGRRNWLWAGTYIGIAILSPLLFLIWQVCRGQVTDLDVQLREQRRKPLLVTLACGAIAWMVMLLGAAPTKMTLFAVVLWLQTIIIFFITLRWKISMHAAAATAVAVAVWGVVGSPLLLLIGVPLIGWSRVRLRRHTLAQVVAGVLLSLTVFLPILPLLSGG